MVEDDDVALSRTSEVHAADCRQFPAVGESRRELESAALVDSGMPAGVGAGVRR
jgi:hypothetical protein